MRFGAFLGKQKGNKTLHDELGVGYIYISIYIYIYININVFAYFLGT